MPARPPVGETVQFASWLCLSRADADRAGAAARQLQQQLAAYLVTVRAASAAPPAAGEGRQPPTPSIGSPTCSAGLTREEKIWRASLGDGELAAPSASGTPTQPGTDR
jgi:hypothetical protein